MYKRQAEGWTRAGKTEAGFLDYVQDEGQVSFPWTMIDKITPRPDPAKMCIRDSFVSTLLTPKKFSLTEKETAKTAFPMGLCFITEGVLPFAAADPARFIPASMIGSALAGGIAVAMGVESVAGHGGILSLIHI